MTVRIAAPTDAESVAPLVYMAGLGPRESSIYDLMIDGPPGPITERLSTLAALLADDGPSWLNYPLYLVAEQDGRIAGSLCTHDREEGKGRRFVESLVRIGWTPDDLKAMGERMAPVFRVEPDTPRGSLMIENVAVDPEFRGGGVVDMLIESAVERGRERGSARMQLGVLIGNERAIRVYERHGFKTTEEFTDPDFERVMGSPGMYRMVLPL